MGSNIGFIIGVLLIIAGSIFVVIGISSDNSITNAIGLIFLIGGVIGASYSLKE